MSKDDVEDLGSSRGYANPGCPICPVCAVPSLAMHDGDLCMGCGADIFAMARDNRERAMARSRMRRNGQNAEDKEQAEYIEQMIENQRDHEASHMPWML